MAQCATTALAGAVPRGCMRGTRGRFGGLEPVPRVVSLPFPPSQPACPGLRVAGRPVRVFLTLARWYAIPRGLCVPRARSGCPSGIPRVPFACVCAQAPAASAPPPWVVWRAHLARSRHWALVGPLHVVRAPPRVLPRSLAPSGVLGGGRSGPGSPLPGLGLLLRGTAEVRRSPSPYCPPTGRGVGVRYPRAVGAGVWVWGPMTVPFACMPCGGCVPRGWCGGGPSPGGGWPATVVRGVWCQALSLPRPRFLWSGQPGFRDPCPGCGRCGRGDPAPAPQRAPLRAGVARCGGGGTASPGGVPSTVVRGV